MPAFLFREEPRSRLRSVLLAVLVALLSGSSHLIAQSGSETPEVVRLRPARFPGALRRNVEVLGDRFYAPGKERLILTGTLTRDGENEQVQLLYEVPGRFRLAPQGGTGRTLVFDGSESWSSDGQLSAQDEDLLESFARDSADGFFADVRQGGGTPVPRRRLPWRRRLDAQLQRAVVRHPPVGPPHPRAPRRSNAAEAVLLRPQTQDFSCVFAIANREGAARRWSRHTSTTGRVVGGQQVPGKIARLEGNSEVLSFQTGGAAVTPRVAGRGLCEALRTRLMASAESGAENRTLGRFVLCDSEPA